MSVVLNLIVMIDITIGCWTPTFRTSRNNRVNLLSENISFRNHQPSSNSSMLPANPNRVPRMDLTHWGRVTHICVGDLTIIGSDNGLSPGRRQAIVWTNTGILLIRTSGTNVSEISSEIHTFSFKKMHFKMSSAKWRPFCLGLNVLSWVTIYISYPETTVCYQIRGL